MWVEEISIEGFKSYARRAVLSGLDPAFNAVTGLNGSGKSNVLDAICFVLGISNLEQVRASSLQELVYKQGQAGVSRASVSITFNNSDSRRSPVGYEHCERISVSRQVVIGGRSTYRINGKKVQPKDVHELFHSVQLNVNNPHFLIMQGRIQKVLSMKPPEILSLLEEAAGTRMYEKKKDSALKTLHKKQAKVDEVDQVLQHEIYPALDRLRKEKDEHDRWCILGDRIKRLNRFVVAHEYTRAKADASEKHSSHSQLLETLRDAKSRENSLQHRTQELRDQVNARKAEREQQLGNNFSQLKKQEDELSKELVQATASWQNKQDSLDSERKEVQRLHDSQQQLAEAASQKSKQEERLQQEYDHAAFEHKQLVDAADHAERAVHGMQTGKGTGDSQSLTEQLNEAKSTVNSSTVEADAAEKKAEQLQSDVLAKREQLERKRTEADNVTRQLEGLKDEAQKAKASLDNHEHDPGCAEEAHRERKRLQSEVESLRSNVDSINGQLSSLEFSFEDPERNFDRSRVKGALGKLVSVHDASESTALEVVAGGKLYQIVVDTDETGKKILQHGQLQKRVTLVPLNKVQANELKPSVIQHASAMSEGKASPAIESVSFDEKFRNAMIYAFGTSFICRDNETAKVVAYNKQSKAVCVTLEGDLHNPAGLLTGGSRGKKSSVLAKVQDLKNAQAELQQKRKELETIEEDCKMHDQKAKEFAELKRQQELKQQELELAEQRLQYTEASQLMESLERVENELLEAREAVQTAHQKHGNAQERVQKLEDQIAKYENDRQGEYKRACKDAEQKRKDEKERREDVDKKSRELASAKAERESAEQDEREAQERLSQAQKRVSALEESVSELESCVATKRQEYDVAHSKVEEQRAKAQEADEDLQQLTEEERQTEEALQSARLEAKKAEKEAEKEDKARKEAEEKQKKLKQNYTWIPSEESQFGREGSDYDFNNTSPEEKKQELQEAEKEHAQLERRVNKEVVSAWDSADAQYKELSTKRQALANDKEKIESVISELDGKKEEALRQTWEKVDADLASIFSLLLPGSSAKLEPEAGKSFLQGLEIKVQLGGTWKESLSELSGGQRSLLALSLILALLLFKPAPIYILDEVDAALDPSHTQNIGRMIREHFPFSQFIIVSLKEGMFSNANALFRTHFIDGSSTVVREAGERIEEEGREEADEKRAQSAKRRKQEVRSRKPLAEADGNAKVNS